jgi:hypothetical protein
MNFVRLGKQWITDRTSTCRTRIACTKIKMTVTTGDEEDEEEDNETNRGVQRGVPRQQQLPPPPPPHPQQQLQGQPLRTETMPFHYQQQQHYHDHDKGNNNNNENEREVVVVVEEEEDYDEFHDVSDAEALLACWSYLQRHKRLGNWTEYEQRRAQQASSRAFFLMDDDYDSIVELAEQQEEFSNDNDYYYNLPPVLTQQLIQQRRFTVTDTTNSNDGDDEEEYEFDDNYDIDYDIEDDDYIRESNTIISNESNNNNNKMIRNLESTPTALVAAPDDSLYGDFISFPTKPSESRIRRSRAIKKVWSDAAFRQKWYERRWGNRRSKQEKERIARDRRAEKLARALPAGFLGSEELASMTEEEIAHAIQSRVSSVQKRVTRRRETLRKRKEFLLSSSEAIIKAAQQGQGAILNEQEAERLSRDVLFTKSREQLEAAQKRRSERAKKVYATRLKNEKEKLPPPISTATENRPARPKGRFFPPKQPTPRDAMLRIEHSLDHDELPAVVDLRLIMEPIKLKNRRPLLLRILNNVFGMRGKCVPMDDDIDQHHYNNKSEPRLEFATHCSIKSLGDFVIHLIEKGE